MLKPFRKQIFPIIAAVGVVIAHSGQVSAQTFVAIKEPECLSSVGSLFTTGEQYVDTATNGVLGNSWSMLTRWQGSTFNQNSVSYDLSGLTGMNYADTGPWTGPTVGSVSNWQRGMQTESQYSSTPGVQMYCNMMGMVINTWWVPHRYIEGGGYNDMFGYSWSGEGIPSPDAFVIRNPTSQQVVLQTDLIVQANIAVPSTYQYINTSNTDSRGDPDVQVSLFAYVVDIANPSLHPIALVSGTHDMRAYNISSVEGIGCDYSTGVYFASTNVGSTLNYSTRDPASAYPQLLSTNRSLGVDGDDSFRFFRMRITPTNFANIIADINSYSTTHPYGPYCPTAGYSTDISNYQIRYAGIITEATLFDNRFDGTLNDANKDQVSIGLRAKDVGIYRRY